MSSAPVQPRAPKALLALLSITLLAASAGVTQAQMTFYASWAGFNAAAPGATVETFEEGVISTPSVGASFAGALTSATSNGVFAAVDIVAGVTFSNSCAPGTVNLILAGSGFDSWGWSGSGGFPSKVLIPSSDTCSLTITFAQPVGAAAMDIYAESDAGYRVSVYGTGDVLLQNVDSTAGETSPGFFGVVSTVPITRLVMKAPSGESTGSFEAADNVAFRVFEEPEPIPMLDARSLAVLSVLLAGAGVIALRRSLA